MSDLQEEQDVLQEEIDELDAQLVEVIASVGLMEEQIEDTQEQIVQAQEDYDAAKAQEEAQYQAMKARLRYLYEKGDTSYMELLTKASNWSDMLNQAEYIEKLHEYDQKMLNAYIAIKEEVEVKKNQLEDKKSELESQRYELKQEEAAMEEMLEEKKAVSADYDTQIAKVRQEAAAYKAQIKQQNAELKQLDEEENAIIKAEEERRKKEEEARKKQEEAKKAQGGQQDSSSSTSSSASSSGSSSGSGSSGGGSKTVPPATGSTGTDIAQYACQFVGNPYVLGGTSLTDGADCSGFIWAVYKQYGYSLPRTSTAQRSAAQGSAGREVSYEEAQPGDIICYAGHVALYLGGGADRACQHGPHRHQIRLCHLPAHPYGAPDCGIMIRTGTCIGKFSLPVAYALEGRIFVWRENGGKKRWFIRFTPAALWTATETGSGISTALFPNWTISKSWG